MILWGPPGTGKTTLAFLMAQVAGARFVPFSAVLAGVKEIRQVVAEAEADRARGGKRTILFVDEIHRFNKGQQDAFLPHVEKGTLILIGATTENPSFEVNAALLSRCRVYSPPAARRRRHREHSRARASPIPSAGWEPAGPPRSRTRSGSSRASPTATPAAPSISST